jgi:hypothetical protein
VWEPVLGAADERLPCRPGPTRPRRTLRARTVRARPYPPDTLPGGAYNPYVAKLAAEDKFSGVVLLSHLGIRSGALRTASDAASLGRPVMAVPDGDVVGVDAQQFQSGVAVTGDVGRPSRMASAM